VFFPQTLIIKTNKKKKKKEKLPSTNSVNRPYGKRF